jgi:lipoate-protein ligase A
VDALLAGLATLEQPALRWYAASEPALVIGSGQKLNEIDIAACQAAGVSLHRRASGGTTVFFDQHFVMLDIALPTGHPLRIDDVTESYRWLGVIWVQALQRFGLDPHLIAVQEARADTQTLDRLTRQVCFGGHSPYEVLVDGRKLVGFSQVRRRSGAILQVGLYLHWSPQHLADLLLLTADERTLLVERLQARVAGLADLLPDPPDLAALMESFAVALYETQGAQLAPVSWSAGEQAVWEQALVRYQPL